MYEPATADCTCLQEMTGIGPWREIGFDQLLIEEQIYMTLVWGASEQVVETMKECFIYLKWRCLGVSLRREFVHNCQDFRIILDSFLAHMQYWRNLELSRGDNRPQTSRSDFLLSLPPTLVSVVASSANNDNTVDDNAGADADTDESVLFVDPGSSPVNVIGDSAATANAEVDGLVESNSTDTEIYCLSDVAEAQHGAVCASPLPHLPENDSDESIAVTDLMLPIVEAEKAVLAVVSTVSNAPIVQEEEEDDDTSVDESIAVQDLMLPIVEAENKLLPMGRTVSRSLDDNNGSGTDSDDESIAVQDLMLPIVLREGITPERTVAVKPLGVDVQLINKEVKIVDWLAAEESVIAVHMLSSLPPSVVSENFNQAPEQAETGVSTGHCSLSIKDSAVKSSSEFVTVQERKEKEEGHQKTSEPASSLYHPMTDQSSVPSGNKLFSSKLDVRNWFHLFYNNTTNDPIKKYEDLTRSEHAYLAAIEHCHRSLSFNELSIMHILSHAHTRSQDDLQCERLTLKVNFQDCDPSVTKGLLWEVVAFNASDVFRDYVVSLCEPTRTILLDAFPMIWRFMKRSRQPHRSQQSLRHSKRERRSQFSSQSQEQRPVRRHQTHASSETH